MLVSYASPAGIKFLILKTLPKGNMIYAHDKDNKRIEAFSKGRAKCPICEDEVIAICGEIIIPHWAHKTRDCDAFSEPETLWHKEWKEEFPESWREVVIGSHRADVKTLSCVIEFQHSPISQEDIADRESFYGNMIWVIDAKKFGLEPRREMLMQIGGEKVFLQGLEQSRPPSDGEYTSFRWKHPRKSWWKSVKDKYFDMGEGWLLHMKKVYNKVPCGGWGHWVSRESFMQKLNNYDPFDF